jgi:predicted molibdopterin-dependent oxidoreductase YjgC
LLLYYFSAAFPFRLILFQRPVNIFILKIKVMKHNTFNQAFIKLFMLITLSLTAFSFTTKFGLDGYEVYLNNKLILKQYVNQPLSLRVLQLDKANEGDELHIKYKHCTKKGPGTGRSIVLKDEKGNTLKKWAFADATDSDFNMTIAVKELLQLEKKNAHHELSLHYTARELPKGEMLGFVRLK